MLGYVIKLTPDDNDTFLVTCPALPEVTTFGATDDEIERAAVGAIEEAIAARLSHNEKLPAPVEKATKSGRLVKLPALTAFKAKLAVALQESGITRAELARRLDWHREQVDRLFRIGHASKLDQIEAAFKALGREIDVNVVKASPPKQVLGKKIRSFVLGKEFPSFASSPLLKVAARAGRGSFAPSKGAAKRAKRRTMG